MWLELKKSSFRAFATRANKGSGRGIYNIKFARIAQYILVWLRVAVFAPVDLITLRRPWCLLAMSNFRKNFTVCNFCQPSSIVLNLPNYAKQYSHKPSNATCLWRSTCSNLTVTIWACHVHLWKKCLNFIYALEMKN